MIIIEIPCGQQFIRLSWHPVLPQHAEPEPMWHITMLRSDEPEHRPPVVDVVVAAPRWGVRHWRLRAPFLRHARWTPLTIPSTFQVAAVPVMKNTRPAHLSSCASCCADTP